MNISAPPTSSRSNGSASRTSSFTKIPKQSIGSRSSSSKSSTNTAIASSSSANDRHLHSHSISSVSPLTHPRSSRSSRSTATDNVSNSVSANSTALPSHNSSTSLLRLSPDDAKEISIKVSTPSKPVWRVPEKSLDLRSKSLTLESSKKLDQFINNVKSQLAATPSPPPNVQKLVQLPLQLSQLNSAMNLVNLAEPNSINETDKRRLVKQFYEESKSNTKGVNTPMRNDSLTASSEDILSPDLISNTVFDNYDMANSPPALVPSGNSESSYRKKSSSPHDAMMAEPRRGNAGDDGGIGGSTKLDLKMLSLRYEVVNEIKLLVTQREFYTTALLNLIDEKKQELDNLTEQLNSVYQELSSGILKIQESDYSKYSSKEKLDFSKTLDKSEADLNKYRNIITKEKSLMTDIDEDLKYLEFITLKKFQRARSNRNRLALVVLTGLIFYLVYSLW